MWYQVAVNTAEHSSMLKEWTEEEWEKWEKSGVRTQYGHFSVVFESQDKQEAQDWKREWDKCLSDDDPSHYCYTHNSNPITKPKNPKTGKFIKIGGSNPRMRVSKEEKALIQWLRSYFKHIIVNEDQVELVLNNTTNEWFDIYCNTGHPDTAGNSKTHWGEKALKIRFKPK